MALTARNLWLLEASDASQSVLALAARPILRPVGCPSNLNTVISCAFLKSSIPVVSRIGLSNRARLSDNSVAACPKNEL